VVNFDLHNGSFDPFVNGFSFAFGFNDTIPENIGKLGLKYITRKSLGDDKGVDRREYDIPYKRCNETSGYPMKSKRLELTLMCFDALSLPEEWRNLRGEYFSDLFALLQVQLKPCVNKTEVKTTQ